MCNFFSVDYIVAKFLALVLQVDLNHFVRSTFFNSNPLPWFEIYEQLFIWLSLRVWLKIRNTCVWNQSGDVFSLVCYKGEYMNIIRDDFLPLPKYITNNLTNLKTTTFLVRTCHSVRVPRLPQTANVSIYLH